MSRLHRKRCTHLSLSLFALGLAGCGGGGGSAGGGTSTPNTPPTFTSAATVAVVENTVTGFYTATATDAQGTPVTFTIVGGADAARFAMTASGALSFVTAPNFDLAGDADGDNVYQLTLGASDGSATTTLNLTVTVTNSKEGVQVRRVATEFTRPTAIATIPGSTSIYVAQKNGGIYLLDPSTGIRKLLVTVPTATDGDRGITAIYTSPDHASTGYFFVLYSAANGDVKLTRYRRNLTNDITFVAQIDLTLGSHAANSNNYGGWIGASDALTFYVATGDGGGTGDPGGTAQSTQSNLGKLLRVDINPDPFAGAAPAPFATFAIVANGFRNPAAGDLTASGIYLPDRGQTSRDEVNFLAFPRPAAGWGNYGWPFKEGTLTVSAGGPAGLIDPVTEYARGSGAREGQSIVACLNYRGSINSLSGFFVIFDLSGKIFTTPTSRLAAGSTLAASNYEMRTLDFAPDAGAIDRPVSAAQDGAGNIFIVDDDGEIFRLTATGA